MSNVNGNKITRADAEKRLATLALDAGKGKDVDVVAFAFVCEAAENGVYKYESDTAPKAAKGAKGRPARDDDAAKIVKDFAVQTKAASKYGAPLSDTTIAKMTTHFRAAIKLGEHESINGSQMLTEVLKLRMTAAGNGVKVKQALECIYGATVEALKTGVRPTAAEINAIVKESAKTAKKHTATRKLASLVKQLAALYKANPGKKDVVDTAEGNEARKTWVTKLAKSVEALIDAEAKKAKGKNGKATPKAEAPAPAAMPAKRKVPTKRGK